MAPCDHCKKEITDDDYLESDGLCIHEGCLDAWEAANAQQADPKRAGDCAHCKKPITDRTFLESEGARIHKPCLEALMAERAKSSSSSSGEEVKKQFREVITCVHCTERIEEKEYLKTADGSPLHTGCKDAYLAKKASKVVCGECEKPISGGFVELSSAEGLKFHPECLTEYKRKHRPKCHKCKEPILENNYLKDSAGNHYHEACTK